MTSLFLAHILMASAPNLHIGANLSFWFWLPQSQTESHFRTFIGPSDAKLLRANGFDHVRLPLEPKVIFDNATKKLRTDRWQYVREGVKMLQKGGLSVILDVHPVGDPLATVDGKPERTAELFAIWDEICGQLDGLDEGRLWLELMNEPHDIPDATWEDIQKRLVARIRSKQPGISLVLTGAQWGSIDGLIKLTAAPEKNAVYSFHFYDPHSFTHQGASWGARNWPFLKKLPYPSDPERVKPAVEAITDHQAQGEAVWYGNERWNRAKIDARIDLAVAWAAKHKAKLYCGEFGVYAKEAPPADRVRWYGDVTNALFRRGIGFAFWDYQGADSFGITNGGPGQRKLLPHILNLIQTGAGR